MPLRFEFSGNKIKLPQVALAAVAISAVAAQNKNHNADQARLDGDPADIRFVDYEKMSALSLTSLAVHTRRRKHHHKHQLTPAEQAAKDVTPYERWEWEKVHYCEGNPWNDPGPIYPGGLGITTSNWTAIRDKYYPDYPVTAATATENEQIEVAEKIQDPPPDQHGCQPGGW